MKESTPNPMTQTRIPWVRVPVEREALRALTQRSDLKGGAQTLGFLALIALTGTAAFLAQGRLPWWAVVLLVFIHGTFYPFLLNGFHELCHQTVFRTRALNTFFLHLFSLLSWHNLYGFTGSHTRHHQHTLHPPMDLEVVLPITHTLRQFLTTAFINLQAFQYPLGIALRLAAGRLKGPWEEACFGSDPAARARLFNWARITLAFHVTLTAVCLYSGLWLVPVLTTFTPFYGGWLLYLLNNTQHVGLKDNVPDFRLCCRTIYLNPFLRFLYWHMNYHTEHHMYAAVPCYNLGRLHEAVRPAMPPCPNGVVATWKHIGEILQRQKTEPGYQYAAPLPDAPQSARAAQAANVGRSI